MLYYRGLPREEFLDMCDYSLHSVRTRSAKVVEKLVTHDFRTGAHEDSPRRKIVRWLSAYFLVPNWRSRGQSSITPRSCFQPIPATPLRSFARSTRACFTPIMTRSNFPMARSCC